MEFAIIIGSLALVSLAYLYVSKRDGSYVNVMTPTVAFLVPACYLLEMYHLAIFGPSNTLTAYALSYGCYAGYLLTFAYGYGRIRVPTVRLPFDRFESQRSRLPAYLTLAMAIALFLPIALQFRDLLTNPRAIYEQTRTGYGVNFFLSTTLSYLALVLLLFSRGARSTETTFFTLFCAILAWLHGSKGEMLELVFILGIYAIYVKNRRVSLPAFFVVIASMIVLGLALFLITTPGLLLQGGANALAGYSEYTRNGMKVIDSGMGPLYGRLTLEAQIYPRIPRVLFPDKPHDFGGFYLAAHFFPDAFAGDTGAPAFGYGTWYADFSFLALPILMAVGLFSGILLKLFMTSLRTYRTPGNFVMVLFASGIPLIPIADTFLLPESLLLAIAVNALYCLRLRRSAAPASVPSLERANSTNTPAAL